MKLNNSPTFKTYMSLNSSLNFMRKMNITYSGLVVQGWILTFCFNQHWYIINRLSKLNVVNVCKIFSKHILSYVNRRFCDMDERVLFGNDLLTWLPKNRAIKIELSNIYLGIIKIALNCDNRPQNWMWIFILDPITDKASIVCFVSFADKILRN